MTSPLPTTPSGAPITEQATMPPEIARAAFNAERQAMIRRYCVTVFDRRDFPAQLGRLESFMLDAARPHFQMSVVRQAIPLLRAGASLPEIVRSLAEAAMGRAITDAELDALLAEGQSVVMPEPTPAEGREDRRDHDRHAPAPL